MKWRMPEYGTFGFDASLSEVGIGSNDKGEIPFQRFVFKDGPISVTTDEWLEVEPQDDGSIKVYRVSNQPVRVEIEGEWEN